jgi:hypothetical protein
MNISISDVIESLQRVAKLDPKILIAVETDLEKKVEEIKADKEPKKRSKHQLSVIILDPEGHVKGDVTAFVFKQPEEADATQTLDKVHKAAYEHNRKPKIKHPVKNVGEAGVIKRKTWKEQNLQLLNKEPAMVLVTKGPIPTA